MALNQIDRLPARDTDAGLKVSAMRALKDRAGIAERLALVLCGAFLTALLFVLHVEAKTSSPVKAVVAQTRCQSDFQGVPCLGPIQSLYAYDGYGSDKTSYLKAKFGPLSVGRTVFKDKPKPGQYEVTHRTVTWHSAANVEIVAVYVIHRSLHGRMYQKLPTGPHSGHTTLTATKGISVSDVGGSSGSLLLLQGRREARQAQTDPAMKKAVAAQSCKPISRHEPCLAPIQSVYAYAGEGGGDTTYIKAKAGKQKVVGQVYEPTPRPGLWQVAKRTFTWHSVAGVKIVAVFVVHGGGNKPFVYQRVPSGPHSGHTTLTSIFDNTTPTLLLEGRREARQARTARAAPKRS
jgi:hypothetical protein